MSEFKYAKEAELRLVRGEIVLFRRGTIVRRGETAFEQFNSQKEKQGGRELKREGSL